ncbi:hypothetical protein CHS0354_022957 [Potamilus streckersoni]|uniref:Uncharacterized protein n=1 Tax=Potamilus streckersoni TaxID=2493646 RepID=A0AAE0S557_9BIVA|nr:hypothetical protein CHS0354_022957 [Potamilus streckersoni]
MKMSNNIKGKCVGSKIGNAGSFFLEAHVPTCAGDAYDTMASLKAKTGSLNHTGVRSMREQSIGDDDDVPSPKILRLSQYCTDRQDSSSKLLGVSYSDITTYADPFPENEQDVGYSSHSTCSSCQGPEGAATDHGSPLVPQQTQWDLENYQKDMHPQNGSSEVDDLIYHFERFFHERFEDELRNFRESVHAMISDQQAHVRQIVHSAVCEAQVKELSGECSCKCDSPIARETGSPPIFTEAHADTRLPV